MGPRWMRPAMSTSATLRITVFKIAAGGKVTVFRENTGGAAGLMFGPDARLYACQTGRKRIVAFAPDGKESTIADSVSAHDLAIDPRGEIYFTDPQNKRIWFIDAKGNKRLAHQGVLY